MDYHGNEWIKFDELDILTESGWRLRSAYQGVARIDAWGQIIELKVAAEFGGVSEHLLIHPEDGQIYDDITRTLAADYHDEICEAAGDAYSIRGGDERRRA